tara:strand:- start:3105 stop:3329 length:225 start_codon:yes stop_codon:yes gene_type:complete
MKSILDQQLLDAITKKELDPVVLKQLVENEVLEALMVGYRYNQLRAAKAYGVSRGTFRVLLKERFGDKYVGTRA